MKPRSWPTTNEMPSLSTVDQTQVLNFVLNRMFGGVAPFGPPWDAIVSTLARVMDKSIREYEGSRLELDRFVKRKGDRLGSIVRAADHLETCVSSVVRAVRLARTLRRAKEGPRVDKTDIPTPELVRRLQDIRDAAEHIYERLQKGKIAVGEPIQIQMMSREFELQGLRVSYGELASTLERLHALTRRLVGYQVAQ